MLSVISSAVKGMKERRVRRAVREYIDKVSLHSLSNIKITNYFNYKPRFNGVFSRNNLSRIRDRAYVINLRDEKIKEYIGFLYLLTEIQVYNLMFLELDTFLKKY